MTDRAPLGPPYEYHLRIPAQLRNEGWRVGSIAVSHDKAAFLATVIHAGRPETGASRTWEPSREEAVDLAVLDLTRNLDGADPVQQEADLERLLSVL